MSKYRTGTGIPSTVTVVFDTICEILSGRSNMFADIGVSSRDTNKSLFAPMIWQFISPLVMASTYSSISSSVNFCPSQRSRQGHACVDISPYRPLMPLKYCIARMFVSVTGNVSAWENVTFRALGSDTLNACSVMYGFSSPKSSDIHSSASVCRIFTSHFIAAVI